MRKKGCVSIITFVFLLMLLFTTNANVYADINNNIVTPQGAYYVMTFSYPDHWSSKESGIYAGAYQVGILTMNVRYTINETWYVDQFGNKVELISTSKTITQGDYEISSAGHVEVLENVVRPDGQTYYVKTQLTYSDFMTYTDNHYFYTYEL